MKKILSVLLFTAITSFAYSQSSENSINMELGKGLNISLNGGEQVITLGGYLQFNGAYIKTKDEKSENRFDVRRGYFNVGGKFFAEKLSVFAQFDFADSYPLLDAWIGYHPAEWITITAGQKQSFSGTRSMMFYDQALSLGERSLAAKTFFASGRELGFFFESRLPLGQMGLDLGVAVTSGDGRNSFGSSSIDYDLGGFKYSGRASFYPLGFFTGDNDLTDTDFAREQTVKLVVGGAYSYNAGASDPIGEGHNNLVLYKPDGTDADGNDKFKEAYPDYQKISADLMIKYQGFTFLAEYINATAAKLNKLYVTQVAAGKLVPKQIADFLTLGNAYSFQAGYIFPKNWAIDVRYAGVVPEWSDKTSLIRKTDSYTAGIAKYFVDNRLKLQLVGTFTDYPKLSESNKQAVVELNAHIVF